MYDIFLGKRHLATWNSCVVFESATWHFYSSHEAWCCPVCGDIWLRFLRHRRRRSDRVAAGSWHFNHVLCSDDGGVNPFPESLWHFQGLEIVRSFPKEFLIWQLMNGPTEIQALPPS